MTATAENVHASASAGRVTDAALSTLYAGSVATIAFDLFGQSLSPGLGFASLAPVPLANQVISTLFGSGWTPGAHFLHYMAGIIAYPLGWLLVVDPLRRRIVPQVGWLPAAIAYGVALWVFALYVMAHLVAGMPAFLGFGGITWVALVGHVVFAVVAASVYRLRASRA